MKNENLIESKVRNLTFVVIFGLVILGMLVIGLYFKDGGKTSRGTTTNTGSSSSTTEYDVSRMKQVTGAEAAKLFDQKGVHFLYIGRSTCGVCVSLVPQLNKVIDDLGITMNYLPLIQDFRTDFKDLFDHLDIETKINNEEGTFGELLKENGYTPMVFVIKDGKLAEGFVGNRTSDIIEELFKKYI